MRIESDWKENSPADNQFPATCPRPRKNVCEGGAKVAGKKWKESMLAVGEREGKVRLSTTASLDQTFGKTFGRKEDAHRLSRTSVIGYGEHFFPPISRNLLWSFPMATSSILNLGGNVKSRCAAKLCRCNRITGSLFSRPAESKAALDERNTNEGKPKTKPGSIARA